MRPPASITTMEEMRAPGRYAVARPGGAAVAGRLGGYWPGCPAPVFCGWR